MLLVFSGFKPEVKAVVMDGSHVGSVYKVELQFTHRVRTNVGELKFRKNNISRLALSNLNTILNSIQ